MRSIVVLFVFIISIRTTYQFSISQSLTYFINKYPHLPNTHTPRCCSRLVLLNAQSNDEGGTTQLSRRKAIGSSVSTLATAFLSSPAHAQLGPESTNPLWLALPVAPYARRKTLMNSQGRGVWTFDQLIGIYYVQLPIRMTVVSLEGGGLFVYAPVAPTEECLSLMQTLIDEYGPVKVSSRP